MTSPPNSPAIEPSAGYPVPRHLTPGGLAAFRSEVAQYAVALGSELEKQEVVTLSRGGQPEHTAEAVERARRAYLQRVDSGATNHQRPARHRDRSTLAVILLTAAMIGLNIMQNFLHSGWQIAAFVVFILIGLSGLVLTWIGRVNRSGAAGDP